MNNNRLKQLIHESINEYIREIDEAGTMASIEAKMNKTQEAIELREKKMNMEGIDEAYHDMIDKGKMKELSGEVKALKKSLAKYEKQLEKLKNKGKKSEEPKEETEKEIVDEVNIDETFPPSGPQLEEDSLNEEMVGGVNYDSTIAAELKAEVGNLDKLTPYVLEKGDNVQSDSSGKIHVTDSETKKKIIYKDIADFLRGIGYQVKMNEQFLHMQKLAGLITESEYKKKLKK